MTRQPHDQFAKQYLEELLSPLGTVEVSREVTAEVRQVDVYFSPQQPSPSILEPLGLLGRLVTTPCLLEPYRNAPSQAEVKSCLLKLIAVQGEVQRQRQRQRQSLRGITLPRLWILASSLSRNLLRNFEARLALENWTEGVYFLAPAFQTGLIAINQLPVTPETLWLRLLGKGATQETAITELLQLAPNAPLRSQVLEQIANWRRNLELKERPTRQEQELIMTLSPAYLQWRDETLQEGRQEGREEGRQEGRQEGLLIGQRLMVENLLKARFGELDAGLMRIIEPLLELPTEEVAQLLVQLSREELLTRFNNAN